MTANTLIRVERLEKTFILHNQGGLRLPVLRGISVDVAQGECVVLAGPSGSGKSTLLRCLYGNYLTPPGTVRVRHEQQWVDVATASPRDLLAVRRKTIGYVSQFLRVIPRIPTLDIVSEPIRRRGVAAGEAMERAKVLLTRLRIPERLWTLPPATFSGGEQQRVNIARGFIADYPVLLLDEPTAALDADNRRTVIDLIREARERGSALVGIFHDEAVRDAVGTRPFDLSSNQIS